MVVVLIEMAAAVMEPIKYEALKREVMNGRSFGWASSPIKADPAMMAKRIPNPSSIRAMMYMATNDYEN